MLEIFLAEETAIISIRHHWFYREMTTEERAQNFHFPRDKSSEEWAHKFLTNDVSLPVSV